MPSRSASGIDLSEADLEQFTGDALTASDVARALDGVGVVVQALGVSTRDLFGTVRLFSGATNLLVPGMERAGVGRPIAVTGFGAGDSRDATGLMQRLRFRLMLGRASDDADAQEIHIGCGGLAWTLVRPGILTDGVATGRHRPLTEP